MHEQDVYWIEGDGIGAEVRKAGGIRSFNVALRQSLDLYACIRPVRHFQGLESPVKHPELVNMVIFRENTKDVYAGIEYPAGSADFQRKGFAQVP